MSSSVAVSKSEPSEQKYLEKCKELKRRIAEIEDHNEAMALSISRTTRSIQRLRLERSFLLEKLEERTFFKVDDSDGSASPPPSPLLEGEKVGEKGVGKGTGRRVVKEAGEDNETKTGTVGVKKEGTRNSKGTDAEGEDATVDSNSGSKKRNIPPRNPNLPKRPQNAYIIFCEVEKERVRNELEHIQPGEPFDLTKAMAEAWKDLGSKGRSPFYSLYEDDKLRYIKEMAAYSDPNATPSELREKQRAIKALKEIENRDKLAKEKGIVPSSDMVDMADSEDILRHSEEDMDGVSESFAMDDTDNDFGDNEADDHGMDTEPPSSMGIDPDDN